MELNFNTVQRPILKIVLADKEQTHLSIKTPKKLDKEYFDMMFEDLLNDDKNTSMDDVYKCCAKLLSYNLENIVITPEKVREMFNIDDVIILFTTYREFITGTYNLKN